MSKEALEESLLSLEFKARDVLRATPVFVRPLPHWFDPGGILTRCERSIHRGVEQRDERCLASYRFLRENRHDHPRILRHEIITQCFEVGISPEDTRGFTVFTIGHGRSRSEENKNDSESRSDEASATNRHSIR